MVRLIETGINTGIYQAEVDVDYKASNPSTKRIKADLGDDITVTSVDDPSEQDSVELPVPTINVTYIKFDHEVGEDSDAVNIKFDDTNDVEKPEWIKDERNNPACYIKEKTVSIMAKFSVSPNIVYSAIIGAESTDSGGSLGDVLEETVTFTDGNSQYWKFWIDGNTPSTIKRTTNDQWQWYFKDVNGSGSAENNANISGPHKIYTILDEPQSPWSQPWTVVLDYACDWASGEDTESEALEKITEGAYCGLNKEYDGGITHAPGTTFHLTAFLNGDKADCRDMSAVIHVFSRAIGCSSLQCRQIDSPNIGYPEGFWYKRILPVGKTSWIYGGWWNYHQVGVRSNTYVYDSCILLCSNPLPYPPWCTGVFSTGSHINGSYKSLLYLDGDWDLQNVFDYTTID
jgi:hypothetical protein